MREALFEVRHILRLPVNLKNVPCILATRNAGRDSKAGRDRGHASGCEWRNRAAARGNPALAQA